MSEPVIKARLRDIGGKSAVSKMRRNGEIPAVLYGAKKDSVALTMNRREFAKLLSETRSVFIVDVDNQEQRSIVKEIQYHPVRGDILHVDMQRVTEGQEINITVPIHYIGKSPGVKDGGIFQALRNELEIACLPKYIPESIEVDISELNINEAIHVRDLNLENITIRIEPDLTLCSVVVPRAIEEEEPEEEVEEFLEEEAEPEVISQRRKEDEESEEEKE